MAGGREFSSHQRGIINRYYEHQDTIVLQRLGEIVSDLAVADPGTSRRLWESAAKALSRTSADPLRVKLVLSQRKVEALAQLVAELSASPAPLARCEPVEAASAAAPPPPQAAPPQPAGEPAPVGPAMRGSDPNSAATLQSAMKAFRKRLKLTRLDEESKLGRNPLSSGKRSAIVAIMPPREFPRAVWDELVRQGKLRSAGSGFYELVE